MMPRTTIQSIWGKVTNYGDPDKCWEWQGGKCRGYGIVSVGNRSHRVHRLVYKWVKGDPGSLFVCHLCDNPSCCNPDHLWLGTTQDNMNDMVEKGRSPRPVGESNGSAKLSVEKVKHMFVLRRSGFTQTDIASKFSVSRRLVGMILSGKRWGKALKEEGVNHAL